MYFKSDPRVTLIKMKGLSIAPNPLKFMVRPRRFERLTHSLEGCCSIQLSYGRIDVIF